MVADSPPHSHQDAPTRSVGVIIPVYNSGRDAIDAIRSVLAQEGYRASEIIVIDDGSRDGSADLIRVECADIPIPLRLFSIPNGGAANARNYGIRHCACEYVAFLDSDDRWYPDKLARQMAIFDMDTESIVGMVGCLTTMGARPGQADSSSQPPVVRIGMLAQLFKNHFQTSTVIIRRHLLNQVGAFPDGQRHAEEGDLFNRIAAASACMLLPAVLVDYSRGKKGFGESGLSANLLAMERGELNNLLRAFKRRDCGVTVYLVATLYSLAKFIRRLLVKAIRKNSMRPASR